jgi:hypothetical protein
MKQKNQAAGFEVRKIIRTIMLSAGWLVAAAAQLYAVLLLNLHWNLFDWSPKLDYNTAVYAIGIVISLCEIWFLGKFSRDKISWCAAVPACLILAWIAIHLLPAEPVTSGLWLSRSQSSPLWFRGGITLFLCMPGIFCFWWIRRHITAGKSFFAEQ